MYSIEYIRDVVNAEGLGYCIEDYFSAKDIEDQELRELWCLAEGILLKIRKILEGVK